MPFEDPRALAAVGLRPAGTAPSFLETVIGGAGKAVDSYIDYQEKNFKKEKDKVDMYVTLRKAGYSSDEAYRVIATGKIIKPLAAGASEYDLDLTKKKLDIEKTTEDIAYTKAKKEALGKGGGYDNAEDIPASQGGLPLKSVKQDKKTGMWYGEYGEKKSNIEDILNEENIGTKAPATPPAKYAPPAWLTNIIGSWEKPALVKEEPIKKTAPAAKTSQYSNKQEATIQANMRKYGKSREEIIAALTKKGIL